jgi:hypothetical protein
MPLSAASVPNLELSNVDQGPKEIFKDTLLFLCKAKVNSFYQCLHIYLLFIVINIGTEIVFLV